MNILLITPIYLPHMGGIEKYVHDLAIHLSEKNKVVIFTADQTLIKSSDNVEDTGIRVIRVPVKSYAGILFLKNRKDKILLKSLLAYSDIVHSNDCKFLYKFLGKKKQVFKYKLFLSSHGFIFHTDSHSGLKKLYFKFVVARYQNYFDRIICVSEQDQIIANKYGIRNTVVILPGVDIDKFRDLPKARNEKLNFVYYGRIAPNKGIKECIIKLCAFDEFQFTIIGSCDDDNYKNQLLNVLSTHGKLDSVNFMGRRDDNEIRSMLSNADFILMPSLHEGFGMTLAECLNSGKGIIANTNTSFMKILKDTKAECFLFDFEDQKTNLKDKVLELQNKCVVPVNVDQFSIQKMYEQMDDVYLFEES